MIVKNMFLRHLTWNYSYGPPSQLSSGDFTAVLNEGSVESLSLKNLLKNQKLQKESFQKIENRLAFIYQKISGKHHKYQVETSFENLQLGDAERLQLNWQMQQMSPKNHSDVRTLNSPEFDFSYQRILKNNTILLDMKARAVPIEHFIFGDLHTFSPLQSGRLDFSVALKAVVPNALSELKYNGRGQIRGNDVEFKELEGNPFSNKKMFQFISSFDVKDNDLSLVYPTFQNSKDSKFEKLNEKITVRLNGEKKLQ
jgi:hypothetical protein